jgi:UTP:GlnB (protein PII) uridylyltransferase
VTGPDRPGLLHALTSAFAAAGVNVHAARIATDGSQVVDHFDLTDRRGAKLDEPTKARVLDVVVHGVEPRRRRQFGFSRDRVAGPTASAPPSAP